MKIFLTRHGESKGNLDGIYQGDFNSPLTFLGVEQAKKLALRLSGENIQAIYSSGLIRAYDTAKEIAKYHKGIEVKSFRGLNEKSHGIYAGLKKEDHDQIKHGLTKWDKKPIGGESINDMILRIENVLKEILEEKKDCIIVSHQGVLRVLRYLLLDVDKDVGISKEKTPVSNTAVFAYDLDETQVKTLYENCVKHLDGDL